MKHSTCSGVQDHALQVIILLECIQWRVALNGANRYSLSYTEICNEGPEACDAGNQNKILKNFTGSTHACMYRFSEILQLASIQHLTLLSVALDKYILACQAPYNLCLHAKL